MRNYCVLVYILTKAGHTFSMVVQDFFFLFFVVLLNYIYRECRKVF